MAGWHVETLDSLRVGVVVLDAGRPPGGGQPVGAGDGPAARRSPPGTVAAHPILRTLAGQVRRSGVRREVELDLPRGTARDPLGVNLRAVGLGGGFVAVEAADVTEAHRVARVRRDFVANVSHELKTPIGALQLLAEALLDATDRPTAPRPPTVEAVTPPVRRTDPARVDPARPAGHRTAGAVPAAGRRPAARARSRSSVDWLVAEVLDRARTGAAAKRIDARGRRRAGPDRLRQRQPARHRGGQPGRERDRLLAARAARSW